MTLRHSSLSPAARRAFRTDLALCVRTVAALLCFVLLSLTANAKDNHQTAIILFDGPNGPAYVQMTGLTVNGKTELRVCDGAPKFDKRAYDNFLKTQLAEASSLERSADGVLTLMVNSKAICVVPNNVRFEKNAELSAAEAADQAVFQGLIVSSSIQTAAIPAVKPGIRVMFAPAPDTEFAEYLLAQRTRSAEAWQGFLTRYPASARVSDAKNALAELYEQAAESSFREYQNSSAAHAPDLARLKAAQQLALVAENIVPGFRAAQNLRDTITKEIDALLEADRARLQAFRKALAEHTAGYLQLTAAQQHSEQVLDVNPQHVAAINLHSEIVGEERKLDSAVQAAEALVASRRYDDALKALGAYSVFGAEVPRIRSVVSAVYLSHFGHGQELANNRQWDQAAAEFRQAKAVVPDSKEADAALKNAEQQLDATRNRLAAESAIEESNAYAAKNQVVEAYETLANLPPAQQSYAADELRVREKSYIPAAFRRAQKLQEVHLPIRGRADEDAIRQAYDLLDRASSLSGDPAMRLKLDLLSDKISAYYVEQAKRYLQKPSASGVGLGWLYLGEAEHYKPHMEAVKEAMAQYAPAYQLHSRLSVGVVLRDQTSRRDSLGFADQLRDAIANGLESSGISIKVLRQVNETDRVQPNFQLIAEILDHRVVNNTTIETLQSKYRAATHEVKSPAWLQASQDYDAAQQQLTAAQRALADAQAQHKKKEIVAAASDAVAAAQQAVADAQRKLDGTEQTRTENVIEPYNYTKKNVDLTGVVDLAFRITDQSGNAVDTGVPIRKNDHKSFALLENVKPEDTEGVKKQGTEADEVQFLSDLEIQARDALIKAVQEKVLLLTDKILADARSRAQQGDLDGAAEEYIVYLNAVSSASSQAHEEASQFLHDHFNVTAAGIAPASTESRLVQPNAH
jgi:hypothetical protein